MPYMNCPRCGLTVGVRTALLAVEHCPGCLARSRGAVLMASEARAGRHAGAASPTELPRARDRVTA